LKWLFNEYKIKPKKIINIIIQPRTPNPIRKTELDRKELGDWFNNKVYPIITTHKKGKPSSFPCNPGEVQCRWCKVKECRARAQKNINDAARAFAPFTKTEMPKIETATSSNSVSQKLSIAEMAELKGSFKAIQDWIKDIEDIIKTEALKGTIIPGYKLVEGKSNRTWKVDENKMVTFFEKIKVNPYVKKLISPAQATKLIGEKKAKEVAIQDWITKPQGKPIIVPITDKRPEYEVKANVEKEFKKVLNTAEPILVDEETKVPQMSIMQRMQFAELEDEEVNETATGGNVEQVEQEKGVVIDPDDAPASVIISVAPREPIPPAKTTKRYQLLKLGGGTVTIHQAAIRLGCSKNMIKMHLRYLNERDGYGYSIFSDGTFRIFDN